VAGLLAGDHPSAQTLADGLLAAAVAADRGRPQDDMSVLVVAVVPGQEGNRVRRLAVTFPVE
jgi:hypothetical protein